MKSLELELASRMIFKIFLIICLQLPSVGYSQNLTYASFSLIWDGSPIQQIHLNKIKEFRLKYPMFKFHHFICPSYFIEKRSKLNQSKIKSLILDGDQVGMYLNAKKPIVEKANVLFRISPSFWGGAEKYCTDQPSCGSSIPITAYSSDEIESIIRVSQDLLQSSTLKLDPIVMVAGWQRSDSTITKLHKYGYKFDFSRIEPQSIERRLKYYPILEWVKQSWSGINSPYQSVKIISQRDSIISIPQSGGVVDYSTREELGLFIQQAFERAETHRGTIFNVAIHVSTAARYLARLDQMMQGLEQRSNKLYYSWHEYMDHLLPSE